MRSVQSRPQLHRLVPSRVLHGVLEADGGGRAQQLAANADFQEALLNCAVELVALAWHAREMPFPAATMQLRRLHKYVAGHRPLRPVTSDYLRVRHNRTSS